MRHYISVVDVLLDIEVAAGQGVACIEGLLGDKADACTPFGDVNSNGDVGHLAYAKIVVYLGTHKEVVDLGGVVERHEE